MVVVVCLHFVGPEFSMNLFILRFNDWVHEVISLFCVVVVDMIRRKRLYCIPQKRCGWWMVLCFVRKHEALDLVLYTIEIWTVCSMKVVMLGSDDFAK